MPDILKRICAAKQEEIERLRRSPRAALVKRIEAQTPPRGFRAALREADRVALIAELKRASPSAGVIRPDFHPAEIARQYERGGARCLSVLTDERFFQGSLAHLAEARDATSLPVLRKDFVLEEAQVLEARAWGADCVLLIVAALGANRTAALLAAACELGMDVLVEVHNSPELEAALNAGAPMIGINNRDLRTFEVRIETTLSLAPMVPDDVTLVAESGIRSRDDVEALKGCGVDAVLVGESLMQSSDLVGATRLLSDV